MANLCGTWGYRENFLFRDVEICIEYVLLKKLHMPTLSLPTEGFMHVNVAQ